jgi:hypothetical protein
LARLVAPIVASSSVGSARPSVLVATRGLPPLPHRTRTVPAARFTSVENKSSASARRSPVQRLPDQLERPLQPEIGR